MTTTLATHNGTPQESALALETVLIGGDLSALTPAEKVTYYLRLCESLGLNPYTKPFEYLRLNGKLILYAKKDCADQLRKLHGVSIQRLERERIDELLVVTATASTPDGRMDSAIGAVATKGLQGETLANALMKAETKAKRRVTLSICGLGMTDESEVDSIPGAQRALVDDEGQVIEVAPPLSAAIAPPRATTALPAALADDAAPTSGPTCEDCGVSLEETRFKDGTSWPPAQLAGYGRRKHGRVLCMDHYRAANEARKEQLLGAISQQDTPEEAHRVRVAEALAEDAPPPACEACGLVFEAMQSADGKRTLSPEQVAALSARKPTNKGHALCADCSKLDLTWCQDCGHPVRDEVDGDGTVTPMAEILAMAQDLPESPTLCADCLADRIDAEGAKVQGAEIKVDPAVLEAMPF